MEALSCPMYLSAWSRMHSSSQKCQNAICPVVGWMVDHLLQVSWLGGKPFRKRSLEVIERVWGILNPLSLGIKLERRMPLDSPSTDKTFVPQELHIDKVPAEICYDCHWFSWHFPCSPVPYGETFETGMSPAEVKPGNICSLVLACTCCQQVPCWRAI